MPTKRFPALGVVSDGTMLSEDLIPAFMYVLDEFWVEQATALRTEYADVFTAMDGDDFDRFEDEMIETAGFLVDELFGDINAVAAPYSYFSSAEGDGACYGFWPAILTLEYDARTYNGVVKVNAGDPWEYDCTSIILGKGRIAQSVGTDIEYVMEVNDHGNITLLDAQTREEIWSVV